MLNRCFNPNYVSYWHYGFKGITVCKRWKTFTNFLEDMGERPEGTTLDRFPNNKGNYEPGNCRWANVWQQANNKKEFAGVRQDKNCKTKPWQARIMIKKKRISLGFFTTKEKAIEAHKQAKEKQAEEV